jgi:hypothetical protein
LFRYRIESVVYLLTPGFRTLAFELNVNTWLSKLSDASPMRSRE